MYTHLERPSALPPVTDVLLFSSAVRLPVWEEVPRGAKYVTLTSLCFDPRWLGGVLIGRARSARGQVHAASAEGPGG